MLPVDEEDSLVRLTPLEELEGAPGRNGRRLQAEGPQQGELASPETVKRGAHEVVLRLEVLAARRAALLVEREEGEAVEHGHPARTGIHREHPLHRVRIE